MDNFVNSNDIPLGFGMLLAQNSAAMNYFAGLTEEERQKVLSGAHKIGSKEEMQSYVNSLGGSDTPRFS